MPKFEPKPNLFIISVETQDGEPKHAWVFPSIVFDAYASKPPKGNPRDLDLDTGSRKYGLRLKDLQCGFRNRWELIIDFDKYELLLSAPEALEDILAMIEAMEANEGEAIEIGEYEHCRSTALPS